MGTYYYFFAEVRIKDKWYGLNPTVRHLFSDEYISLPVMQGQSWCREAYEKLRDSASCVYGVPCDLSEQVKQMMCRMFEEPIEIDNEYYNRYLQNVTFTVNYADAIKSRMKKDREFLFHGYVSKRLIAEYEADFADIDEWYTEAEYKKLDPDLQMQYTYYEWNDDGGWYSAYKAIEHCIDCLIQWMNDSQYELNYKESGCSCADLQITTDKVRLVIYRD